jgi:DNA-directed RNA polymerase subunit M/transcription elongation factor TFIIS
MQAVSDLRVKLREAVEKQRHLPTATDCILDVLEELNDYVIDAHVLKQTGIGKEVGALRKHAEEPLAKRAEELTSQWRKDHDIRLKVIEGFKEKGDLKIAHARKMEEGLFHAACPLGILEGDHYRLYQRHFKRLSTHLRSRGPGSLVQRLADGELNHMEVALKTDMDLMSSVKRLKAEEYKKAGLREVLADGEVAGTVTDEYTCPKCGQSRTTYQEIHSGYHTDGQDATIIVTCLDCSERWKASDDHGLAS